MQVNLYASATNNKPIDTLSIQAVIGRIRSGHYRKSILRLRETLAESPTKYGEEKKRLEAVTFSGVFNGRRAKEHLIEHSGIIVADLDHVENISDLTQQVKSDPQTFFCFLSPSGEGLKVGYKMADIPADDAGHKQYFQTIKAHFKQTYRVAIDKACADVSRLCFVSYDPGLYFNPHAEPIKPTIPESVTQPVIKKVKHSKSNGSAYEKAAGRQKLQTACDMIRCSVPGGLHIARRDASRLVGGAIASGILDEAEAIAELERAVQDSPTKDFKNSMKTIMAGLNHGKGSPIEIETPESNNCNTRNSSNKSNECNECNNQKKLTLVYNRYKIFENPNPVEAIKAVSADQALDNTAKTQILALLAQLVTSVTPCNTSVTPCNICNFFSNSESKPVENTTDIASYVSETSGWFKLSDVYDAFGAKTTQQKGAIRVAIHRLVKTHVIDKHKTLNGMYRRIEREADDIDFLNASTRSMDLWLPLGLHNMVKIMPGNIILVAGSPNAGKTGFLLNTLKANMTVHECYYFSSEMEEEEFKMRLEAFRGIALTDWRFKPKKRTHNFQDVIVPGKGVINFIDYIEMHDNFYEIGSVFRDIHDRLDGALCIVAIQKKYGAEYGKGGAITLEKPRLALHMDGHKVKVAKAKAWKGGKEGNPNGKEIHIEWYDEGSNYSIKKDWHYPVR